jgi:2-oxoglutarate ferredoxin oxidoreductase subunit beta
MDRKHMMEMFQRAHAHRGAAFVEVYQNCNVFNDGAFEAITAKDQRGEMTIELRHGEPVRFGNDREHGIVVNEFGECEIREVAEVGEDRILVHDEHRSDPALAFSLSRLADRPTMPTPIGIFRDVERPSYEAEVQRQLVAANERQGPGDLASLLGSGATWTVD